ncbi:MAG: type II toxin-antitoxin system mRNA interferase toxin, RelE/StbE family [Candidatus Bipolaricaulota bacterium]
MRTLVWSTSFVRALRRAIRRQPTLREGIERVLARLTEDPFHPSLHTHKLKGELIGAWACTVDHQNRVLFEFVRNPDSDEEEILLLTMGTHDEVY